MNLITEKNSLLNTGNLQLRCPQAGQGVHQWIFQSACHLRKQGCSEALSAAIILSAVKSCGRIVPPREVHDAVAAARHTSNSSRGRWPLPNAGLIDAVISKEALTIEELKGQSKIAVSSQQDVTETVIDFLFPADSLLCCGWSNKGFDTRPRQKWRGMLHNLQFIVPSPMSSCWGQRKTDGLKSSRTLNNTGPRRFLVIEFDDNRGFDTQATRLWHLSSFSPLALAVHSGGKSLHGWFYTANETDVGWLKFMQYAVAIGADRATWTRCQFVRLPGGLRRQEGKPPVRQEVVYVNPEVVKC